MRRIIALAIVVALAVGCSSTGMPTAAQYAAAQQIVAAADSGQPITPDALAHAHKIIDAYEDPGIDWWQLGGAAAGALLGIPALGGRGRKLIGVGIDALRHGEIKRAAGAAAAYSGLARSRLPEPQD